MKIDSAAWRQTVIDGARELGIEVSNDHARAMGRHALELLQWNRVSNLTTITDPMDVAIKHFVDSLAVVNGIPMGARILDAGSGGGFPGLPLKIVRPEIAVTLVDGVRKKVSFLKYVIGTLKLERITAVHGRLEDLGRRLEYRGRFDLIVCRALASLEAFAALTMPLLSTGGRLLAMKGPQGEHDHEIDAIADDATIALAGRRFTVQIRRYTLPILGDQRRLVWLTPV